MALMAVLAAYVFHLHSNIPNFYSMHSWVGLITIALLVVQVQKFSIISHLSYLHYGINNMYDCQLKGGIGAFAFLFPIFGPMLRITLRPYHEYLGNITFALAIVAAVSGLNERAFLTS